MGTCRAGSLPNVNHIGSDKSGAIDLQSALNNLDDIRHGREPRDRRTASPGAFSSGRNNVHGHGGHYSRQMQHSDQKRADASPYSTPYLSPPDTWRRTNSDSALHQSAMLAEQHGNDGYYGGLASPASPRRSNCYPDEMYALLTTLCYRYTLDPHIHGNSMSFDPGKRDNQQQHNNHLDHYGYDASPEQVLLSASLPDNGGGMGHDPRPKSCEVPGIAIYPTQEEPGHSHHHIPLSSNTGSLPDLTNLHFPAPLATPIDLEDEQQSQATNSHPSSAQYNNSGPPPSPYSATSNCGSPSPYSPQSPNSIGSAFSPPPPNRMTGGIMFEAGPDGSMKPISNGNYAPVLVNY